MKIFNQDEDHLTICWVLNKLEPPSWAATFVVKATYPLFPPGEGKWQEPPKPLEPSGPNMEGKASLIECLDPNDLHPYKPRGEFLLKATAYPPGGEPSGAFDCGFALGSREKTLHVFGNRQFTGGVVRKSITDPELIEKAPLRWAYAYGGPQYAANPVGMGYNGGELPNIESSHEAVRNPSGKYTPAGFGPLMMDWEPRRKLRGSYRRSWLKTRWPWYPEDMDMGYFMDAQPDQQFEDYLRGDETYQAVNLHPVHARIEGQLPGIRTRLVFQEQFAEGETVRYREVKLMLDTAFFDFEEELLCLTWRGVTTVQTHKLREIQYLLFAPEPIKEPKSFDYYRELLDKEIADSKPNLPDFEKLKAELEAANAATLKALDEAKAEAAEEQKWAEQLSASEEKRITGQVDQEIERHASEAGKEAYAKAKGAPPATAEQMNAPFQQASRDAAMQQLVNDPRSGQNLTPQAGEMLQRAESTRAEMNQRVGQAMKQIEEADKQFDEEEKRIKTEVAVGLNAAFAAHGMVPELAEGEEPAVLPGETITREKVEWLLANNKPLSLIDMAGLDLSGLDFSGHRICMANFSKANLAGAKFDGCHLLQCTLDEATLPGASLRYVVLERSSMNQAEWKEAASEGLTFTLSSATGCDLSGATFKDWRGTQADFSECNFEGSTWVGVEMAYTSLGKCKGRGAKFEKNHLLGADFSGADFSQASFEGSVITNLRSDKATSFREANFARTSGLSPIFTESDIRQASFQQASLERPIFAEVKAQGAHFAFARLPGAIFDEAQLDDAVFVYAHLLRSSFQYARLIRTDFAGTNLYESGFLDARIEDTDLSGANIRHTLLANYIEGKFPVSLDLPEAS